MIRSMKMVNGEHTFVTYIYTTFDWKPNRATNFKY